MSTVSVRPSRMGDSWVRLGCVGCAGLGRRGSRSVGLGWVGLGWAGVGWLGWAIAMAVLGSAIRGVVGLGWVGLGRAGLSCVSEVGVPSSLDGGVFPAPLVDL